jgi:hypothetical protein
MTADRHREHQLCGLGDVQLDTGGDISLHASRFPCPGIRSRILVRA